jgi:HD-GYP domain-containing protein (c-di-GMP phosphodiesterase class II)
MDDYEKLDVLIKIIDTMQDIGNPWWNGHQKRCAALCVRFLEHLNTSLDYQMNITAEFTKQLSYAARCHDIGKANVHESILNRLGRLTKGELKMIQEHSINGYLVIDALGITDRTIALIVKFHHERWDATGYPDGIKELTIPFGARILGIVDSLDAMTNDRPYRKVFSVPAALKEMDKEVGKKFDPQLYAEFRRMMEG